MSMPGPVRATLRTHITSLPRAEAAVAEYVLNEPHDVIGSSIEQLASAVDVSAATIVRTVRRLGFSGYGAFKIALAHELGRSDLPFPSRIAPGDDAATVLRKIVEADVEALRQTAELADGTVLEAAVTAMADATTIEVYGIGSSAPIAMDAAFRLRRTGLPVALVLDAHMLAVSSSRLAAGAVALVVSHTGRTPETVDAARSASTAGATVIAVTSFDATPLTDVSDIVLLVATAEAALGTEAMATRIAHLSTVDALCVSLALRSSELAEALRNTSGIIEDRRVR